MDKTMNLGVSLKHVGTVSQEAITTEAVVALAMLKSWSVRRNAACSRLLQHFFSIWRMVPCPASRLPRYMAAFDLQKFATWCLLNHSERILHLCNRRSQQLQNQDDLGWVLEFPSSLPHRVAGLLQSHPALPGRIPQLANRTGKCLALVNSSTANECQQLCGEITWHFWAWEPLVVHISYCMAIGTKRQQFHIFKIDRPQVLRCLLAHWVAYWPIWCSHKPFCAQEKSSPSARCGKAIVSAPSWIHSNPICSTNP